MKRFDSHIHYAVTLDDAAFDRILEQSGTEVCALQCIHQRGIYSTVPDTLRYKAGKPRGTVYVQGSLERTAYIAFEHDERGMGKSLVRQANALLKAGCDGIKLLEGKPDIRRAFPIPDFDAPAWEPFWELAESREIAVTMHVNDPEDFWDEAKINPYARSEGWFYGPETVNNEEQYRQMGEVLRRHPGLKLQLAHFYFFSAQLPRMAELMRTYSNVRIDLTPGIELYINLARNISGARAFFEEFSTRILYGTDMGSRATIAEPPRPVDVQESLARVQVITEFLERTGRYTLVPDGKYLFNIEPEPMEGLGLAEDMLRKIYYENAMNFFGAVPREVDLEFTERLERGYERGRREIGR